MTDKKTTMRKRLTATAYHEAGHAVAAFALNLSLGRVSIIPVSFRLIRFKRKLTIEPR